MKKVSQLSLIIPIVMFLIIGCSGSANTRTIDVIGIDELKYVVAEQKEGLQTGQEITVNGQTYYVLEGITAKAGNKITINLKNISDLPATAMSHNWLLLEMNTDVTAFNRSSMTAKDNGYVAPDMEDQVITDTGLVGDGETKSTTFTVPEQTGEYDYICTFPGHFAGGMRGTLTVE